MQYTSVLVGFNNIIVPTILCNYGSSKFYLAKHSNCEYILLFIQLETDNIPSLFAIAVEKIELQNEPEISTEEFHILLKQFNSRKHLLIFFYTETSFNFFKLYIIIKLIIFANISTLSPAVIKNRIL